MSIGIIAIQLTVLLSAPKVICDAEEYVIGQYHWKEDITYLNYPVSISIICILHISPN